ncbi:MAG: endonuclease V [Halobacteriota archaeon]
MVDGCRMNKPRKAGLATHIAFVIDLPTIHR